MTTTTDDKLAIAELAARAFFALDDHDVDAWSATFTPDGVFATAYGEFVGAEKREQFLRGHIDAGQESGARHVVADMVIDVDGDRATTRFYVLKLQVVDRPAVWATGVYEDELVRTDLGWKYARRNLSIDPGAFVGADAHD